MQTNQILVGDALTRLKEMPDESVQCCVTSPPYWGLRDYGVNGQMGLEKTLQEYIAKMVGLFQEVRRVLRDDGTLWLNLGDSYNAYNFNRGLSPSLSANADVARPDSGREKREDRRVMENSGSDLPIYPGGLQGGPRDRSFRQLERGLSCDDLKPKDLIGVPWRVAFGLQADGWYLRSDIVWSKPNPMPESITDRPTKAHEYVFLMAKSQRYYYDADAIRERAKPESAERYKYPFTGAPEGRKDPGGHERIVPKGMRKLKPLEGSHGTRYHDGQGMRMPEKYDNPAGRNRRTVWEIPTSPFPDAHFAVFPEKLIEPCILAGCPEGGVVLDPFMGSGTTALVAIKARLRFLGVELNPEYAKMAEARIWQEKNQARLI